MKESLVSNLVTEARKRPEKLRALKQREKDVQIRHRAIEQVASELLEHSIPIDKAGKVQNQVKRRYDIDLSLPQVRTSLKQELGLGYRMAKKVPIQGNSERCLVLRQQYSITMLSLLNEGKRLVNIDESWINETNFTRKIWCPADAAATITQRAVTPRLTLIAALDTEGRLYFSLTHANTDSDVLLVFLKHLMRQLDNEDAEWASKTVFLLDGARYHTSEEMREYLKKLQVQVIFSGPYSYAAAPIEMVFGVLKRGELNPERRSTGKK